MYFVIAYFNKYHQKKPYAETSYKMQNSSFTSMIM